MEIPEQFATPNCMNLFEMSDIVESPQFNEVNNISNSPQKPDATE